MQQFLLDHQAEIAEICRKHHVTRLEVFGSAARDDFDPARSDVDLLVEFGDVPLKAYAVNKFDLEEDLVRLFRRDIDLLVFKYVRNPYLRSSIDQSRQALYAA